MEKGIDRTPERNLETFNRWLNKLSVEGKVEDIEPSVIRFVLEGVGANFEIGEDARESLAKYSNKGKRRGLEAVWGSTKMDTFKNWVLTEYIPYIEKAAGRELHTLFDKDTQTFDDVKHSGMMQFLGELTAYASGAMSFEKYQRITENRYAKGKKWQYGNREEIYVPSKNASFPVDFPRKAIDRLNAAF